MSINNQTGSAVVKFFFSNGCKRKSYTNLEIELYVGNY